MKITTAYPIIVHYKRISNPEQYLNAAGDEYTKQEILGFQQFANNVKMWSPKLTEDGKWGPKTEAAAKVHGADYKKVLAAMKTPSSPVGTTTTKVSAADRIKKAGEIAKATKESGLLDGIFGVFAGGRGAGTGAAEPTVETATGAVEASISAEDARKKKNKKIALIAFGGLLTIAAIYFIAKASSSKSTAKTK